MVVVSSPLYFLHTSCRFNLLDIVDAGTFDNWTRPLTDCAIKVGPPSASPSPSRQRRQLSTTGSTVNTAAIEEFANLCASTCASNSVTCGGNGPAASNYILQWLEEAIIDLGCLVSPSLAVGDPDRCDAARARLEMETGATSDCWVTGWEMLFGVTAPVTGLGNSTATASIQVGPVTCSEGDDNGVALLSTSGSLLIILDRVVTASVLASWCWTLFV